MNSFSRFSSISRLKLMSRTENSNHAWQVQTEGREIKVSTQAVAHPQGTTIEICDLFFNTPARRKFLRAEKTEFTHIEEVIKRIALSRFNVAIRLRHNNRDILNLKPASSDIELSKRIKSIFSHQFTQNMEAIDRETNDLHIWGWVAKPSFSRSQADCQYFYVNGRMVRDKLINHAVRTAFEDRLAKGRYSGFVLHLEIDPTLVDVNVHPAKHEVRFRETRTVHDFIVSSVKQALQGGVEQLDMTMETAQSAQKQTPSSTSYNMGSTRVANVPQSRVAEELTAYESLYKGGETQSYGISQQTHEKSTLARKNEKKVIAPAGLSAQGYRILSQIQSQYLLVESDDDLLIVNMPKARITLNCLSLRLQKQANTIVKMPLLMLASQKVDDNLAKLFVKNAEFLQSWGIDSYEGGPNMILIRELPTLLASVEVNVLLSNIAEALQSVSEADSDSSMNEKIDALFFKSILRLKLKLSDHDLNATAYNHLMEEIFEFGIDKLNALNACCKRVKLNEIFSADF